MSRGGFRGGRGGRGGGRGGPGLPWEGDEVDGRPSETFPKYPVKPAGPLTTPETRHVHNYLLFRRQIHDGPLYTQRPTPHDPTRPRRVYDQHQRNSQYVYRGRANADLFTAGVETYSSRFKASERTLPDLSTRPYVQRLFPPELRATLDDAEGKKGGEGKKLKLSSVTALPTAEEVFRLGGEEALKKLELGQLEEGQEGGEEEEEEAEEEDEDYAYDDEDAGDYDAEAYFEDGDEEGDDGDDGGDDGGYY